MAHTAWVVTGVNCQSCGTSQWTQLPIYWGALRNPDPEVGPRYYLGLRFMWHALEDGTVPPDADVPGTGSNCGSPAVTDLDLYTSDHWTRGVCESCRSQLGDFVIEVRDSVIANVRAAKFDAKDRDRLGCRVDPETGEPVEWFESPGLWPKY